MNLDEAIARSLQEEENSMGTQSSSINASGTPMIDELIDPTPDLHSLFLQYNKRFFKNNLSSVEVRWSPRMTLCAGICYFYPGGYCSVRLSTPLLKFRPRSDFVNTLLHEMIHAYLFITGGNQSRDGHGPDFLALASQINNECGSNITVYHSFQDEVMYYRTHVWKCDGVCQTRGPYFGVVQRSMNRPPQKADRWWDAHSMKCGGIFTKISEPEAKQIPKSKKGIVFKKVDKNEASKNSKQPKLDNMLFKGKGHRLTEENTVGDVVKLSSILESVKCPVCFRQYNLKDINEHVDTCLVVYNNN